MTYIYDILLNWTDERPYEFYEWQEDDMIEQIKKLPLIKTDNKTFNNLKNNDVVVEYKLLDTIYKKTITSSNKIEVFLDYVSLFTDGKDVIAVEFDKKGKSLMKGTLLLDEMEEVLEISKKLKITDFNYKIIRENKYNFNNTRLESEYKRLIIKELNKIKSNKNIDKLRYLYYEWFNEINNNFNYMYNKLKSALSLEWGNKHFNLYNLIKLSYVKK
jgi:hypothetical protein